MSRYLIRNTYHKRRFSMYQKLWKIQFLKNLFYLFRELWLLKHLQLQLLRVLELFVNINNSTFTASWTRNKCEDFIMYVGTLKLVRGMLNNLYVTIAQCFPIRRTFPYYLRDVEFGDLASYSSNMRKVPLNRFLNSCRGNLEYYLRYSLAEINLWFISHGSNLNASKYSTLK